MAAGKVRVKRGMKTTPLLIDAHQAGRLLNMLPARAKRLAKRGELPCVILPDGDVRFSTTVAKRVLNDAFHETLVSVDRMAQGLSSRLGRLSMFPGYFVACWRSRT